MTYQKKISFLRRYREAVRQEDTILQEIEELRTQAARVTQALALQPEVPRLEPPRVDRAQPSGNDFLADAAQEGGVRL